MNKTTEIQARIELAAAYRMLEYYGMTDQISTHVSLRIAEDPPVFLINEHGLLFDEITASSLVPIDLEGNKLNRNDKREVNPAGFVIHSALHSGRSDVAAVMHTHTLAGMAVAATREGLLPLNQISSEFYNHVSYHDYEGISLDTGERKRLARSLGKNNAMILRNHGLITTGRSIAEAFYYMYYLNKACEIQVTTLTMTSKPLLIPNKICKHAAQQYADTDYHDSEVTKTWNANLRLLERLDPSYRE